MAHPANGGASDQAGSNQRTEGLAPPVPPRKYIWVAGEPTYYLRPSTYYLTMGGGAGAATPVLSIFCPAPC